MHRSPGDRVRYNLLFETVGDDTFERLRPLLIERRWPAGTTILGRNTVPDGINLIAEGRVKLSADRSGEQTLLAIRHIGDFFGELELLDGRHSSSDVIALDNVVTYELPRTAFVELLAEHPDVAQRLLQVLSVRLRALSHHHVHQIGRIATADAAEVLKLRRLIDAARNVNSTLDLDLLLQIILDAALKTVDAEGGTLYILDEAKHELWSKILRGSKLVEIRLPVGRGIAGTVAASGESLRIDDAYLDPRFNPEFDARSGYRTRSILCLPVRNKDGRTIGVLQLLNKREGVFTQEDEELISALSVHSALALENARFYALERQSIALEKELSAARNVQMSLLPQAPPNIEGYDIVGRTTSAQWVGGDYFDFIAIDEFRTALCLGDVTGKGLPAALLMANLQAILRSNQLVGATPRRILQRTNRLLRQSISEGKFVTLFYGIIDASKHWLVYSSAGHEQPILVTSSGELRRLTMGGTILGILDDLFFEEEAVPMSPGDTVVVFSDGVTEAVDAAGELYGQERLEECVLRNRSLTATHLADAIERSVRAFCGDLPLRDDLTLLIARRN
ncbi:MAG: hypothetical protein A3C56_03005 [Ignavibacteria bacterium RIFCSPHIGHO2_02_FULL_56_12]|nr:MAG: hypothetical protein A3C56_03005 [Ignavibacteria bacterium RIFCSPHIGHO2_02_FULL_56_12]